MPFGLAMTEVAPEKAELSGTRPQDQFRHAVFFGDPLVGT